MRGRMLTRRPDTTPELQFDFEPEERESYRLCILVIYQFFKVLTKGF